MLAWDHHSSGCLILADSLGGLDDLLTIFRSWQRFSPLTLVTLKTSFNEDCSEEGSLEFWKPSRDYTPVLSNQSNVQENLCWEKYTINHAELLICRHLTRPCWIIFQAYSQICGPCPPIQHERYPPIRIWGHTFCKNDLDKKSLNIIDGKCLLLPLLDIDLE